MEPMLVTADRLLPVLEELKAREPIFHRPEHGTGRAALERMTDEGFWEVGASGQRYSRDHVIEVVLAREAAPTPDHWRTDGFHCAELAPGLYLLTYTLTQPQGAGPARVTRRATLWRRADDGWKIVYHQGTLVQTSAG